MNKFISGFLLALGLFVFLPESSEIVYIESPPIVIEKVVEKIIIKTEIKYVSVDCIIQKKFVVQPNITRKNYKNRLSALVVYAPVGVQIKQVGSRMLNSQDYGFSPGILYTRDFKYLSLSAGALLNSTVFLGAGVNF